MKTTKLTALILSVFMIVTMLPTSVFAAPSAVTTTDTAEEIICTDHDHDDEAAAELAYIDGSLIDTVYLSFANGFYINHDLYVVCNTCRTRVYVKNDYDHSIYFDNITPDFSTPGKVSFTFVYSFYDCNGQSYTSEEKTTTVSYSCDKSVSQTLYAKVNNQNAYAIVRRKATSHTGGSPTCVTAANCTRCGTAYTVDHSYSTTYTQVDVDGTLYHRRMCVYDGCSAYTAEAACSGSGTATCTSGINCSTCNKPVSDVNPNNHSGSVNANGIYSCCGLGSEPSALNGVYQISTPGHLVWFRDYVNAGNTSVNAILLNDIDMTGIAWTPIASTALYYSSNYSSETYPDSGYAGTFDGDGYVIKNLSVTGSADKDISFGLFGTVSGTVKNVGVENFTYNGAGKDTRIGSIVGQLIGGKVQNCYAVNLNINTTVGTTNGVAGGIAGCNYAGTVENSYVYNLTMSAGRYGGIVGDNRADTAGDRVGTMKNCYTNFSSYVGSYTGTETDCAVKLDRQFTNGEVVHLLGSQWVQGENGLPALRGSTIYENTCGGDIFYSTTDTDYESHNIGTDLRCTRCGNYEAATLVTADNWDDLGLDDSYVGYYAIENTGNLYWYNERESVGEITGSIVLLNSITIDNSRAAWTPLNWGGDCTFVGRGNTITLKLDYGTEQGSSGYGLFTTCNYSTVKNLILDGYITANTTGTMGAVATSMYSSTISSVLSTVQVTNTCTTAGSTGGLVGYFGGGSGANIVNCAVYADVTGYNAGGLVGEGWNGYQWYSITNAAYFGNVTSTNTTDGSAGAIVGYQNTDYNTSVFTNIYWYETDGLAFYGKRDTENQTYTNTSAKIKEEFSSGKVAYLLGEAWGQNLDTEKKPVLGGEKVYYGYENCGALWKSYGNTPFYETLPEHTPVDGVCTVCSNIIVAMVGENYYETLDEAIEAATSENANVTMLHDTELTESLWIRSGTFTIDLNGKTISSSGFVLYITDTSDIKIIDSSSEATGTIKTTGSYNIDTITLYDSAKLEIAGGTIESNYGYAVSMSYAGNVIDAELTISGGKIVTGGNSAINARGSRVTITDGIFESGNADIFYKNGVVDMSAYPNPYGFVFRGDDPVDFTDITIPEGYDYSLYVDESPLGATVYYYTVITDPEYFIAIDLGTRSVDTNVRYAEINGVQSAITENNDKYIVEIGTENLLVEIVEKTAEGEFVKSQYFFVDMTEKTATKLTMDSYMTTDGEQSIRINNPMGMRFKSVVSTSAKSEEIEYVIDEYGFIVATEDALGETELTLDFTKYVTGVAYNKEESVDIVFDDTNDDYHIFSGYVKNVPVANYKTNLVCKTYTKITVDGQQFVVYGEAVTGNIYDTAKALLEDDTLDTDTKEALTQIIFDYENTVGIPGDGLYPES